MLPGGDLSARIQILHVSKMAGGNKQIFKSVQTDIHENRLYLSRLRELLDTTFTEAHLFPLLEEARLVMESAADQDKLRWDRSRRWRDAIREVKRFITQRRAFLVKQIRKE